MVMTSRRLAVLSMAHGLVLRLGFILRLGLVLGLGLWSLPGAAQTGAAQTDITTVIEDQLAAFTAGDRARAYSHAAPMIQQRFGDAGTFMQMVTSGYAALINPLEFSFTETEVNGGNAVQDMRLVARDGSAWLAHYTLQRMPDGSWRISGCWLEKLPGGTV